MINPTVFIGEPLNFKNKCKIYPPKVKEVLTTPFYDQMVNLLVISQDDIKDELNKKGQYGNYPTPFEFLLINCYHSQTLAELTTQAFLLFTHEKVTFFYEEKKIALGDLQEQVLKAKTVDELNFLDENDFFDFQNTIRRVLGLKTLNPPEPEIEEDPRVARIKAKARERDRIKAKKGSQNGIFLSTSLVAICCMGIGITPLNIGEMSYASISPIMSMMQNKEKYDVDIRSLLAGADSKKIKPKYWIRNLD